MVIISEMEQALSDNCNWVDSLSQEGGTGLVGIAPEVHQCNDGISLQKYNWLDLIDHMSGTLFQRIELDKGLLMSHNDADNAFPPICTNNFFGIPFYGIVGSDEKLIEPGFIIEIMDYELMSGSPNSNPKGISYRSQRV
jgi:hypothetical protein